MPFHCEIGIDGISERSGYADHRLLNIQPHGPGSHAHEAVRVLAMGDQAELKRPQKFERIMNCKLIHTVGIIENSDIFLMSQKSN